MKSLILCTETREGLADGFQQVDLGERHIIRISLGVDWWPVCQSKQTLPNIVQ